MKKTKKGNVMLEAIIVVIILLALIFAMFAGDKLLSELNDEIQDSEDLSNKTKEMVATEEGRFHEIMDGGFLLVLILLWGFVIVSAFMIDSHPIFLVFSLILMIIGLIIAAELGNTYEEFAIDEELDDLPAKYPIAHWVMTNIVLIFLVIAFSVVIVLYGKNKSGM